MRKIFSMDYKAKTNEGPYEDNPGVMWLMLVSVSLFVFFIIVYPRNGYTLRFIFRTMIQWVRHLVQTRKSENEGPYL